MKKMLVAATLLATGSAAYAASPGPVTDFVASCCAAMAACCEALLGCCA
jgi:hypothetical protein